MKNGYYWYLPESGGDPVVVRVKDDWAYGVSGGGQSVEDAGKVGKFSPQIVEHWPHPRAGFFERKEIVFVRLVAYELAPDGTPIANSEERRVSIGEPDDMMIGQLVKALHNRAREEAQNKESAFVKVTFEVVMASEGGL